MRTLATLVAGAALAMVAIMGPSASAGTAPVPHPHKCATANRIVHQMAPTGMSWQIVRADTAKAMHISPCSIILNGPLIDGQRSSLLITPRLKVHPS